MRVKHKSSRREAKLMALTGRANCGRRAFLALLAAALTAGACATTRAQDPAPLRVMSFNIRYGTAADGDHAWPLRRHLTFRAIRDFAPHVLGVQEALRFQLDEIAGELPHYREIGVGRDDGVERGEYSAILYDAARLELLEHGTFWLSDTPDVPGSVSWGNRITRIATWGRFHDRAADATYYVFNTHWDHESQPSRERSAALLLQRIRARSPATDAVIVTGDFNAGEENEAFRALLRANDDARLYDTFRAVHSDAVLTGTFNAFRGERDGPRIDAILASPHWHTRDAAIVLLSENGLYPSDHFPVTATLVLRLDRR
jgi:endonuclease/exonuclease/phosphatase family metal-dependent hydrolase